MVSGLIEVKEAITEKNFIPPGKYITVKEFAEKYHINESTVRSAIARGMIPSCVLDGQRLILATYKYKK